MRTESETLIAARASAYRKPNFIVKVWFDEAGTDVHYFTSGKAVDTPDPTNTTQGVIRVASAVSQRLNRFTFKSTVGAISFTLLDPLGVVTALLRTKRNEGEGISGSTVELFWGEEGSEFGEFSLLQTQTIEDIEYDKGKYKFKCLDIQRQTKKNIFIPKETTLVDDITPTSTAITVLNTTGFETVHHGPSYSENPNVKIGYLFIKHKDTYEIVGYTSKTGSTFTGLIRGAMGTVPRQFYANDGSRSNEIIVKELIYLELPLAKMIYALATNNLYGDVGEKIPEGWGLGISDRWISTTEFINIGEDLWDINDDSKGLIVRILGVEDENGKDFIEKQLLSLRTLYMPILETGELGLRRGAPVLAGSKANFELTERHIIKVKSVKYAHNMIENNLQVDWSWDFIQERFRRHHSLVDSESVSRFKEVKKPRKLQFKTLFGDRHGRDTIRGMFDTFRDSFAGEPLLVKLECTAEVSHLTVGDTVSLNLTNYRDYTNTANINRTFEIQGVKFDPYKGRVVFDLFASTRKAEPLTDYGDGGSDTATPLPAEIYQMGSDVEAAQSGNVSRDGSIVTVNSNFTLNGSSAITSGGVLQSAPIHRVNGDLVIPSNVTISTTQNVVLVVDGFITLNGVIDASGAGHAGANNNRYFVELTWPLDGSNGADKTRFKEPPNAAYPAAEGGYIGTDLYGQDHVKVNPRVQNKAYLCWASRIMPPVKAKTNNASIPRQELDLNAAYQNIFGTLPSDLRGSGGQCGMGIYRRDDSVAVSVEDTPVLHGGNGGAGGGGLVIICKGMLIGGSGYIDVSGTDSDQSMELFDNWADGNIYPGWSGTTAPRIWAGAGSGGGPGCAYIFVDGVDNTPPIMSAENIRANYGRSRHKGTPLYKELVYAYYFDKFPASNYYSSWHVGSYANGAPNAWDAHARVQVLAPPADTNGDPDEELHTSPPQNVLLTKYTNTPQTPEGDRVSIEVTVIPPADANYSHANVYARKQGNAAWSLVGVAENEIVHVVTGDGSTWQFMAYSVSTTGEENRLGYMASISADNFTADYATIRPPTDVTGLRLTSQNVGTVFTTPDLQFTWDLNHINGTGHTDSWFSHFHVEIRTSGGSLLYQEDINTNVYTLTYSENAALINGPYTSLMVRVYQVTIDGVQSTTAAQVTFTNADPDAPTSFGLAGAGGPYGATVTWVNPVDVDLQAVELYLDTSDGFIPSSANKVFDSLGDRAALSDLDPETTYYLLARSRDTFGNTSVFTSQESFTTPAAGGGSVTWGTLEGRPSDDQINKNFFDLSKWDVGTSGHQPATDTEFWAYIPGLADNSIQNIIGPFGETVKAWQINGGAYDSGGWNGTYYDTDGFDASYSYRISFFIYVSSSTQNRLNVEDSDLIQDSSGSATSVITPYAIIDQTNLPTGKWLFVVGVIHPSTWTGPQSEKTGIYDVVTGVKLFDFEDVKFSSPTRSRIRPQIRVRALTEGYAYIVKPRLEKITENTVPIISMLGAADNTQTQIDAGAVKGFDYYGSSNIFMRLPPKIMMLSTYYATTDENDIYVPAYGHNYVVCRVDTENATNRDRVEAFYEEHYLVRGDEWNPYVDRKFKVPIDVGNNAADINPNLLMSFTSMGKYYEVGGVGMRATGFGFYIDSNGDFNVYGQTSSDRYATPTQANTGVNQTDQIGTVLQLEAIYRKDDEEIDFIIYGVTNGPVTTTLSLPNVIYDHARGMAFCAIAQKIDGQAHNATWDLGFALGTAQFQQG